jgi:Ca2+-binding EF-hand superfamily protein
MLVVYFESLDADKNGIISRDDLEACLPHTVESQQLIQQLLRQWDMVKSFKNTYLSFFFKIK